MNRDLGIAFLAFLAGIVVAWIIFAVAHDKGGGNRCEDPNYRYIC